MKQVTSIRRTPTHRHFTNPLRAAWTLHAWGYVDAHRATYVGLACSCGDLKRNTRLAASIAELRSMGVVITTKQNPGEQATYHVDKTQDKLLESILGLTLGL